MQPFGHGRSGASVLWASPFRKEGGAHKVIVKFGDVRKVSEEVNNFHNFVEPHIGGGRHTGIFASRRTPLLGGVVYSLLGADSERLESFGSYFRRAEITLDQVQEVVKNLFLGTCRGWYAAPGYPKPHDLTSDYIGLLGLTKEKLEASIKESLSSVEPNGKLHFRELGEGEECVFC